MSDIIPEYAALFREQLLQTTRDIREEIEELKDLNPEQQRKRFAEQARIDKQFKEEMGPLIALHHIYQMFYCS